MSKPAERISSLDEQLAAQINVVQELRLAQVTQPKEVTATLERNIQALQSLEERAEAESRAGNEEHARLMKLSYEHGEQLTRAKEQ